MSDAAFELVRSGFQNVDLAMKEGKFTRLELEAIKAIAQIVIDRTNKTILKGPIQSNKEYP